MVTPPVETASLGGATAHNLTSWAAPFRLVAAPRTRHGLPSCRGGPNGSWRCGHNARPKSPILRFSTRRSRPPSARRCATGSATRTTCLRWQAAAPRAPPRTCACTGGSSTPTGRVWTRWTGRRSPSRRCCMTSRATGACRRMSARCATGTAPCGPSKRTLRASCAPSRPQRRGHHLHTPPAHRLTLARPPTLLPPTPYYRLPLLRCSPSATRHP